MGIFFYIFAISIVFASIMVIYSSNPVYSVLWLISTFFSASGLFILLGAEFLAMILVVVYVGAVAVLFLFIVMMIDLDYRKLRDLCIKNVLASVSLLLLFIINLFSVISASFKTEFLVARSSHEINQAITNTHAIGQVLYTDFILPFQLSGLILFVAMIGSIALTIKMKKNSASKKQDINLQLLRRKNIKLVKVKNCEGVSGIDY